MDEVRDLVRQHLAEPLHVARPDVGEVVDVDPDGGVAASDVEREAVGDLVLVREVDPHLARERDRRAVAQVDRQRVVGLLRDGGGLGLDASQPLGVGDLEVLGLDRQPGDLGVVAVVEQREAGLRARRRRRGGEAGDGDQQQDERARRRGGERHRGRGEAAERTPRVQPRAARPERSPWSDTPVDSPRRGLAFSGSGRRAVATRLRAVRVRHGRGRWLRSVASLPLRP